MWLLDRSLPRGVQRHGAVLLADVTATPASLPERFARALPATLEAADDWHAVPPWNYVAFALAHGLDEMRARLLRAIREGADLSILWPLTEAPWSMRWVLEALDGMGVAPRRVLAGLIANEDGEDVRRYFESGEAPDDAFASWVKRFRGTETLRASAQLERVLREQIARGRPGSIAGQFGALRDAHVVPVLLELYASTTDRTLRFELAIGLAAHDHVDAQRIAAEHDVPSGYAPPVPPIGDDVRGFFLTYSDRGVCAPELFLRRAADAATDPTRRSAMIEVAEDLLLSVIAGEDVVASPWHAIPLFGEVLFALAPARVRPLYEALPDGSIEPALVRRLHAHPQPGDLEAHLDALGVTPVQTGFRGDVGAGPALRLADALMRRGRALRVQCFGGEIEPYEELLHSMASMIPALRDVRFLQSEVDDDGRCAVRAYADGRCWSDRMALSDGGTWELERAAGLVNRVLVDRGATDRVALGFESDDDALLIAAPAIALDALWHDGLLELDADRDACAL